MGNDSLGKPFDFSANSSYDKERIDEYDDDSSSIGSNSSPLVDKVQMNSNSIYDKPKDLSFLASANFSTDSIAETDEKLLQGDNVEDGGGFHENIGTPNQSFNASFNSISLPINNNTPGHSRRYSTSTFTSPQPAFGARSTVNERPKSALFTGDTSGGIGIGALDSTPLQSPINPSYRQNRHSRKSSFIPPPIIAPNNTSRSSSPSRATSPSRGTRNVRSKSPIRRPPSPTKNHSPFNFRPQEVTLQHNNSLAVKPAHRKGHKYKHSSVSMNYYQEPPPPSVNEDKLVTITDLYPIPTVKELIRSIKKVQKVKLWWSIIHILLSLIVFVAGTKIKVPELATLAHLIFYDSLGSLVIVLVDIMSNFAVWNNSSIKFPFGLGRFEVLVGFALGASLVMVGFDLLSHIFEEFIVYLFSMTETNQSHSHHVHRDGGELFEAFIYFSILIITFTVTVITSKYILAAEKINKIIQSDDDDYSASQKFGKKLPINGMSHSRNRSQAGLLDQGSSSSSSFEPTNKMDKLYKFANIVTKNPTHVLTLLYTTFMILSPLVSEFLLKKIELDVNELASFIVASLFCLTGWKLVRALGETLLLSYPCSDYDYSKLKERITGDIVKLDAFKPIYRIDEFFIVKFNYDLFIIGMKVIMTGGSSDDEARLRFEINRLLNRLIKGYITSDNSLLEITIDIDRY